MTGPRLEEAEDEDGDWEDHADILGLSVDDYDAYVDALDELNAERQAEYGGVLGEMFPDGVDEDNLHNREE